MNLSMKLSGCMIALLGACILDSPASGSVVHTEFSDRVLPVGGTPIDLDGNGSIDFLFCYSDVTSFGRFCDALPYSGRYVATHGAGGLMTMGIGPNQTIPDNLSWSTDGNLMILVSEGGTIQGDWANRNDEKFVALRLFQGGGMYYGWARVRNMGGPENFRLRDWAFENTPNTPITTPPVGDVNIDGRVNVDDLLQVITSWGACVPNAGCSADLNADDTVNVNDLLSSAR